MALSRPRTLAKSLPTLPIARSYAREDAEGNLLHVVVYREPTTGGCIQVTKPVKPIQRSARRNG